MHVVISFFLMTTCVCVLVAQSCPTLCDPMDLQPTRLFCPWDSPGKNIVLCVLHFLFLIFDACQSESIKYRDYTLILTSKFVVLILYMKMRNPWSGTINRFPSLFVTLFLSSLEVLS